MIVPHNSRRVILTLLGKYVAQSLSGDDKYQFALPHARRHANLRELYSAAHHKFAILKAITELTTQFEDNHTPIPDWLNQTTLYQVTSHMMSTINSRLESQQPADIKWRKGKGYKTRKKAAKAWAKSEWRQHLVMGTVPVGWADKIPEEDLAALRARAPVLDENDLPQGDDEDDDDDLTGALYAEDQPTAEEAMELEDLALQATLQHQGHQKSPTKATKKRERPAAPAAAVGDEENGTLVFNFMHWACIDGAGLTLL